MDTPKSVRFLRATPILFLRRVEPASKQRNPACITNTKPEQNRSQKVSILLKFMDRTHHANGVTRSIGHRSAFSHSSSLNRAFNLTYTIYRRFMIKHYYFWGWFSMGQALVSGIWWYNQEKLYFVVQSHNIYLLVDLGNQGTFIHNQSL